MEVSISRAISVQQLFGQQRADASFSGPAHTIRRAADDGDHKGQETRDTED